MRYLFIISDEISPQKLKKLEDTIATLDEDKRNSIELRYVQYQGHASDLAIEASEQAEGQITVVICGGDNVIHEVVNGLAYRATPLAIIPMGSCNHFAHTVCPKHVLDHPEKAIFLLDQLKVIPIDLVRIDSYDVLGNHLPVWSRYFVNVTTFGFESRAQTYANELMDKKSKKLSARDAYLLGSDKAFRKFQNYKMDYNLELVTGDQNEVSEDEEFFSISLCNGKYYNGCYVAPAASIDDGFLDICVFEKQGRINIKKLQMLSMMGKHVGKEGVRTYRATSGIITCKDNSFQLLGCCDGEIFYGHRIRFEVFPEALNFSFFPKEYKQPTPTKKTAK